MGSSKKLNRTKSGIVATFSFLKTICTPIWRLIKRLFVFYKRSIFNRFAYKTTKAGRDLNRKRTLITLISTFALVYFIFVAIIPFFSWIARAGVDSVKYSFAKEERLYFSRPLYNATTGVYEVTGCSEVNECQAGVNARTFNIEDNAYLDLKGYLTLNGGFDPKTDVVSSFNAELNDCTILRFRDKSSKWFNWVWHSEIYHAKCSAHTAMATAPSTPALTSSEPSKLSE